MSNVFVYTALKTKCKEHKELNGHITTSFMKVEGKMPKLTTCVNESIATVVEIKYLEGGNVTVAVVDCHLAHSRRKHFNDLGLTYDYEFIPHITLCSGNKVVDFSHLVGEFAYCGDEYIGFITK